MEPSDEKHVSTFIDYDSLSEEQYFAEMEQKVEYYKKNFPDMYAKAVQWMDMLNESEIYKSNAPNDTDITDRKKGKATDLLKNVRYNGWTSSDLQQSELDLLNQYYPDWEEDRKEE